MFAKKSLAVVALLAAAGAHAQSTVAVYGNVDVAFGSFKNAGDAHRVTKVESGILDGSFLGFKGQEDLGGGLKAFFKLESTIAVDTGSVAGNFWGRTSEIGLANAYGTLTAGNSLSLSARANNAQNPFSVFGRLNGLQNVLAATGTGFDVSLANALTLTSANYSGFSAAAQFSTARMTEAYGQDHVYALQANYAVGPVAAGLTYTNDDAANNKLTQLGGSYDFGVAKGFVQIGRADLATKNDISFFGLGVSAPVTAAGTVLASWTHAKQDNVAKTDDLSVAYDHALSKRTGVYGGLIYDHVNPDVGSSHSGVSVAVGLHHAF